MAPRRAHDARAAVHAGPTMNSVKRRVQEAPLGENVMSHVQSMTNVDGVITPTGEARIPVMDRGFLYGDSVYEVFRTYGGIPLFFDEHWERFENSARLIHLRLQMGKRELTEEIRRTFRATGAAEHMRDVYVRYCITRGEGPVDLFPDPELANRYVIIVRELLPWREEFYSRGVRLAVSSTRRNPVNALDPNIKGGNYLNNVLGVIEARELGADDCIMLNDAGLVTESSNSNVFFVIDGDIATPAASAGHLRGLTREALRDACSARGLDIVSREISLKDAERATESFITSATREVMPVRSLRFPNGRTLEFPEGGGDLTRRAMAHYRSHVDDYLRDHAGQRLNQDATEV